MGIMAYMTFVKLKTTILKLW